MKDGTEIEIKKMSTSHIENTIAMLDRKDRKEGWEYQEPFVDIMDATPPIFFYHKDTAMYRELKKELKNRK
jgi:hypothetical protein